MKRIQLGLFGALVAGQLMAQSRHAIVAARGTDVTLPGQSELRQVTDTLVPFGFASGPTLQTVDPSDGGGYVFGTNGYGDERKAQQFDINIPMNVEGMLVVAGAKSGDGSVVFSVNDDDATVTLTTNNNEQIEVPSPGTSLGEATLNLTEIDTAGWSLTAVNFPTPITVNERFFLVADFSELAATFPAASIGFASTDADVQGTSQLGSWEYFGGSWLPVAVNWGASFDVAFLAVIDALDAGIDSPGRVNGLQLSLFGGNPANDVVQVAYDLQSAANARFMVMNITGARVVDQELGRVVAGEHRTTLDVSGWANGTYFVTVVADGRTITKKLVVQH